MTYEQLGDLAKCIIIQTMQEGEKAHPANDFMERTLLHHYAHAKDHLDNVEYDIAEEILSGSSGLKEEVKGELEHALVRIAILLAKIGGET